MRATRVESRASRAGAAAQDLLGARPNDEDRLALASDVDHVSTIVLR
jgi:hypothetical protein